MPEPLTPENLTGLLIYDGAELIFDDEDPSTYIVCHTAEDLERAFATLTTTR